MIGVITLIILSQSSGAINQYITIPRDQGDGLGSLEISVLCHHNLFSKEIIIRKSGENWSWAGSVQLNPSGTYEGRYPPGTYDLWLLDGNGAHSEYRFNIPITAGEKTVVTFIGHAVSARGIPDTIPPTPTEIIPTPTATPTPEPTPFVCEPVTLVRTYEFNNEFHVVLFNHNPMWAAVTLSFNCPCQLQCTCPPIYYTMNVKPNVQNYIFGGINCPVEVINTTCIPYQN